MRSLVFLALLLAPTAPLTMASATADDWLAPCALAYGEQQQVLFIACTHAKRIDVFDTAQDKIIRSYALPANPSGIAVDGQRIYATYAAPSSLICVLDQATGTMVGEWRTGHTALDPVISADGKTLFVCLKFSQAVAIWDISSGREIGRIQVGREPVSVAPTHDGKFLFVAHHLPRGPANGPLVSATVGIVELGSQRMVKELALPNGSTMLRDIRLSSYGRYAAVVHNLAHYQVPTTQLERGWMNTAALTLVDATQKQIVTTVLLDELDRGAANPWAVCWNRAGDKLFITHAGSHELDVVDFPGLLEKITNLGNSRTGSAIPTTEDLAFLLGLRERLPMGGNGGRSIAVTGARVYVAGYFSDTMDVYATDQSPASKRTVRLQEPVGMSETRRGEALFNDASFCFQHWQSCASCHSEDARVDGLNWDLLNDGLGNPKNTKSLLLAHSTPPAMSAGVRYSAEEAVRAGIQHILFAVPSEDRAAPIDSWLKSLRPIPSPYLMDGKYSASARRGEQIFNSSQTGCASCHRPPLFTSLQAYDVGTTPASDSPRERMDTPTLIELWRTAPYLHDGSAATVREVLTTHNHADRHGRTSQLSQAELDDLVEYLLSL